MITTFDFLSQKSKKNQSCFSLTFHMKSPNCFQTYPSEIMMILCDGMHFLLQRPDTIFQDVDFLYATTVTLSLSHVNQISGASTDYSIVSKYCSSLKKRSHKKNFR